MLLLHVVAVAGSADAAAAEADADSAADETDAVGALVVVIDVAGAVA